MHNIRAYHAADNHASGRTIEKLRFHFIVQEREAFQKGDIWHHLRHSEMLTSELPQAK